jgi:steroid 5-alpha reductase family enzyme
LRRSPGCDGGKRNFGPQMSMLAATLAATFAAFTLLWLLSLRLKDAGIVDFYWGPGFVVVGWLAWWMAGSGFAGDIAFLLALTVWGLRLGWHMAARHGGAEDARYADMRRRHGAAFPARSLWMVFWLQAVILWVASSPVLAVMAAPTSMKALNLTMPPQAAVVMAGATLFFVGLGLEIAADRAIRRFKADPANTGKLLTTGLHAHVRHPNYLGEIVLQWGLGLMALGLTLNPLALLGPALMHGLIWKLSGVPMLEAQFSAREGFAAWRAQTNALWPRFGR